jgi:hypothetical protein
MMKNFILGCLMIAGAITLSLVGCGPKPEAVPGEAPKPPKEAPEKSTADTAKPLEIECPKLHKNCK